MDFLELFAPYLRGIALIGGFLVFGLVLEYIRPANPHQTWKDRLLNLAYLPVYFLSLFVLAPWVAQHIPGQDKIHALFGSIEWGNTWWGALTQMLFFLAAYDFFYYWWHRAQHTFPSLWKLHEFHHSDRALNVTSSTRHHWLEEALRPLVVLLPLSLLFTFGPVDNLYIPIIIGFWPFFIHLNVRCRLGLLRYVIATPQYHRIHHSIEPAHYNHNYAAFCPVWDVLFGTAQFGESDTYPATGIDNNNGGFKDNLWPMLQPPFIKWQPSNTRRNLSATNNDSTTVEDKP